MTVWNQFVFSRRAGLRGSLRKVTIFWTKSNDLLVNYVCIYLYLSIIYISLCIINKSWQACNNVLLLSAYLGWTRLSGLSWLVHWSKFEVAGAAMYATPSSGIVCTSWRWRERWGEQVPGCSPISGICLYPVRWNPVDQRRSNSWAQRQGGWFHP